LVDVVFHRPHRCRCKIFQVARWFLLEEGGGAADVAGAALRLEVGGGGAGVGEGLAAAELRRVGGVAGVEAGEALAEAGGAEAGDGDARVEAADGLIHIPPYSRANKLTLSIYQGQDCTIAELNSYLRGLIFFLFLSTKKKENLVIL
jgi:hypothetical protein